MKLRRAIVTRVTVAALAPTALLALLPAAATAVTGTDTDAPPSATATATATPSATTSAPAPTTPTTTAATTATTTSTAQPEATPSPTPPATATPPASPTPTPAPDSPAPPPSSSTSAPPAPAPTSGTGPGSPRTRNQTVQAPQAPVPAATDGQHTGTGTSASGEGAANAPGSTWTPDHCRSFVPDGRLAVDVTGLPSRIAAGSGWHSFLFSVANHSGARLSSVYLQSFTEYDTGVNENDSLQNDLAQLQFHDPATGRWTGAFQDSYQDATGRHTYPGTFIALVPDLPRGSRVDLHLRVRVDAHAPAGAAFALSTAVYAGLDSSCNVNGDTYDFTVLAAGSHPGHVADARPNGQGPAVGARPQGVIPVVPVTESLAGTGTSEAVPIIGFVGALAVLVGVVLLVASRRRALALADPADGGDPAADDEDTGEEDGAADDDAPETAAAESPEKAPQETPEKAPEETPEESPEPSPQEPREPRASEGSGKSERSEESEEPSQKPPGTPEST